MKKSVRGNIKAQTQADKDAIVNDINKYTLWRLTTATVINEAGEEEFTFEAWVENATDETNLWDDMKVHADKLTGKIDRHDCTHDEKTHKPCKILETYKKV